ncbi:unnamed protein product, partial [Mesorhabditis spiculigera]
MTFILSTSNSGDYNTTLPRTRFSFLNFDSTNGTSFLEAYHGGDPGNSQINAISTFNANVRQMGLFSFSSATTLVNRNSRGLLGIVVGYDQVELVSNTFVPLQYTQTYLNSWKYPWVFEEDQVLFPETTMKLGRLDAKPTKIKFSRQTGYNGTGGFKIALDPQSAYTSDTFAMDITTVAPNYMFNIVDLLSTQTRFLAVFPKIDVQANVALTVCSLDDDSTPTQHMAGFVNCISSVDLTTRVLNCCTRIEPVSNGSSILVDVYNFTYYKAQPSVIFSVELAKHNKALVLSVPFDAFTDDALAVRVPNSEKTVFFVVCLASHHFRKRADEIEMSIAVLTSVFWPHSLFNCEYRLHTGMVTAENTSRPLTIFRNADLFYPIWLFAGTYTLEIPAGCMPTISLGTQEVESVENIISTDCIGSRLIVSPNFNMMPINAYSGVAENITWICNSVDISLELISLIYGSLDIYCYHLDGSTEMRSYNLSQPTDRFKATEVTMLTSKPSVRPCMGNKSSRGEKASNHVAFSVDGESVGAKNGPGPVPYIVVTQPTPIDALPTAHFTTTKEKLKDEPIYKNTRKSSQGSMQSVSTKYSHDSYPIYNPVQDFGFSGGKPAQTGGFPIEPNRANIGFCGRLGSGKSHLINALRGIDNGAPNSAGRYVCDKMEPFRFVEEELQHIVIWEIPYPRSFTAVVDVYDQNMGFDRFYDTHQLQVFKHLFVLIPDGALHDDDIAFSRNLPQLQKPRTLPQLLKQDTVLADSDFEILFATDDRPVGNYAPKPTVTTSNRTVFNYGFIGGYRVGKSAMINAMRGLSSKHPFAAGREKTKPGACEKYEFSDDLLKYGVTLWELHYPKKINGYFEFIDFHNLSSFTAIFILTDGTPSDEDLSFAKIAHRRNATVVFLSSKTDKKLTTKSRADEIPVCDILKQRYVDKGLARFDAALANAAPELCGRVHCFFVSAPVFRSLRCNDRKFVHFLVHERAVFDFLKQKRIISEMLESPMQHQHTAGSPLDINAEVAGVVEPADVYADARE